MPEENTSKMEMGVCSPVSRGKNSGPIFRRFSSSWARVKFYRGHVVSWIVYEHWLLSWSLLSRSAHHVIDYHTTWLPSRLLEHEITLKRRFFSNFLLNVSTSNYFLSQSLSLFEICFNRVIVVCSHTYARYDTLLLPSSQLRGEHSKKKKK